MIPGPLALIVLDGFGVREEPTDNAIALAQKPNLDKFLSLYPHTTLEASEMKVGLPDGQMGNSEVGHLNLGAGRIVYMDFTRISRAISTGDFFQNPVLIEAMDTVKRRGALHLMGLLSDGGVHSHEDHLKAFIRMAKKRGLHRVFIHAFMDGRDTPPTSGAIFLERLQRFLETEKTGKIATISGRYYAMDRDKRWDRVEKAWRAMVLAEGQNAEDPVATLRASYDDEITDEFVVPTVIQERGRPVATIEEGDSVIFFNFRSDRAREMSSALTQQSFAGFSRPSSPQIHFVCLTEYDENLHLPVAYPPTSLRHILAEILATAGIPNLRIAETEKYAHVTFFFNGGEEKPFPGEDRILIPSPKVATYDLKPEMSLFELTDRFLEQIALGKHKVIICNMANPDMVGHTGILKAAIQAVEAVDQSLGRIVDAILEKNGTVIITADHGNCEMMRDPETGQPHTAHTLNPVPFILIQKGATCSLRSDGALEDVIPTILGILEIPKPEEMTGRDLRILSQPSRKKKKK